MFFAADAQGMLVGCSAFGGINTALPGEPWNR